MKRIQSQPTSAGFTIIELLIATAVFSVIMLVITAGILGFTRQYYGGVVASNTQATARTIMSELTQAIQFGKTITTDNLYDSTTNTYGICVDNKLYSYVIGQEVADASPNSALHQAYHGLVVDNNVASCSTATPSLPATAQLTAGDQREMLGDKMRLTNLDVTTKDDITYTVHVRVVYGDDDVLVPDVSTIAPSDWGKVNCELHRDSLQYCAVTDLTTTVQKRLQ